MGLAPDIDIANARLPGFLAERVSGDARRIVVVGARGWIGRTALMLLRDALGDEAFAERVVCFGSSAGMVDGTVAQFPLAALADLPKRPSLLLHLAFLTKDKVAGMAQDEYIAANLVLSEKIESALDPIGVDRLFIASSGAAAFAQDSAAAADLRLYGQLKRDDEDRFAAWAEAEPDRRVAIGRIYSVSGPWINKHQVYALASFILDALAGRAVEVQAPCAVWRSYVAVREVLAVVIALLTEATGPAVTAFETGGEALELADIAAAVAQVCGGTVLRRPITDPDANRYCGDHAAWQLLLKAHGLSHLALAAQISETAAFLARQLAIAPRVDQMRRP